jgi:hypothetical protein
MNLYLLTQHENTGYDTFDSCVVAADSPEDAVLINPNGDVYRSDPNSKSEGWAKGTTRSYDGWASEPSAVKAKLVGVAAEGVMGVVCASFNAG